MRTSHHPQPARPRWLWGFIGLAAVTWPAQGQEDDDWSRHFRLGMQLGLNLRADFSMSGNFAISGNAAGPAGVSGANHFYDDGYMRVDNTGNAQGYTSYWGYRNASQYDPVAQTLTMHSASSFTYSGGGASASDSPYLGVDLAYGGDLFRWRAVKIGWELGFGLLPLDIQDSRRLSTTLAQRVQTYKTTGLVLPGAPYDGGASGYGPTLPDVATALPDQTITGTVTGSRSIEVTLYNIRLGPTLYWPFHRRFALQGSGGFAMGVVAGDYVFNENIVLANGNTTANTGRIGATDVVYGAYVAATLLYHLEEHADLYLGAQFMPLGSTTISGQGRQARLDLGSGVYLSAGLSWPF